MVLQTILPWLRRISSQSCIEKLQDSHSSTCSINTDVRRARFVTAGAGFSAPGILYTSSLKSAVNSRTMTGITGIWKRTCECTRVDSNAAAIPKSLWFGKANTAAWSPRFARSPITSTLRPRLADPLMAVATVFSVMRNVSVPIGISVGRANQMLLTPFGSPWTNKPTPVFKFPAPMD